MSYSIWLIEIVRLAITLLLVLFAGMQTGYIWQSLFLGLLLLILWHAFQGWKLMLGIKWMKRKKAVKFPIGFWLELSKKVKALSCHSKSRKQKKKVSLFFQRFREASNAMPDAIIIVGRDNEILWCNPISRELLGIDYPRLRGTSLTNLYKDTDLATYILKGDFSSPIEFSSPVNNALILSISITLFGKKNFQQLVVARDITQVHNLNRTRRDFIANASHELGTPLTVIYGYIEAMLNETNCCQQWLQPLSLMRQQARRMQNVIHDLLALSRMEMDSTEPGVKPVNIPRLLRDLREEAILLSDSHNHVIDMDIDDNLWFRGLQDEYLSLFGNLIYNAVLHTPGGSKIIIRWYKKDNKVFFIVEDNGHGIDPEDIPRLTERFFRVDKGRSRDSGGTGLGLAIVKQILSRYEGKLSINSEPGKGSQFVCCFPNKWIIDANIK